MIIMLTMWNNLPFSVTEHWKLSFFSYQDCTDPLPSINIKPERSGLFFILKCIFRKRTGMAVTL